MVKHLCKSPAELLTAPDISTLQVSVERHMLRLSSLQEVMGSEPGSLPHQIRHPASHQPT